MLKQEEVALLKVDHLFSILITWDGMLSRKYSLWLVLISIELRFTWLEMQIRWFFYEQPSMYIGAHAHTKWPAY